jgi:hypothetical protein
MSQRSTAAEKARRLNHAREVWQELRDLPAAVTMVMKESGDGMRTGMWRAPAG